VRGRNLKDHSNNDLSSDLYVPHAGKVLIITLENTHRQTLANLHAHFDDKHDKTQVDELDPTNGSYCFCNNLLLVDWSCETRSMVDKDFNKNVTDDNQNGNHHDSC